MHAHRNRSQDFTQRVRQIEIGGIEVDPSGLDLRKVEDVVDQRQQGLARSLDDPEELPLLLRELRVERELGHADDPVHRRADLVTHVREKVTLRPIGVLGLFFGGLPLDHFLLQIARALLDEAHELALTMARPPDPQLIGGERRSRTNDQHEPEKPSGLVIVGLEPERDRCPRLVPDTVAVGSEHPERVARGWKVREVRGAARTDVDPVLIEPFQLVP